MYNKTILKCANNNYRIEPRHSFTSLHNRKILSQPERQNLHATALLQPNLNEHFCIILLFYVLSYS